MMLYYLVILDFTPISYATSLNLLWFHSIFFFEKIMYSSIIMDYCNTIKLIIFNLAIYTENIQSFGNN